MAGGIIDRDEWNVVIVAGAGTSSCTTLSYTNEIYNGVVAANEYVTPDVGFIFYFPIGFTCPTLTSATFNNVDAILSGDLTQPNSRQRREASRPNAAASSTGAAIAAVFASAAVVLGAAVYVAVRRNKQAPEAQSAIASDV